MLKTGAGRPYLSATPMSNAPRAPGRLGRFVLVGVIWSFAAVVAAQPVLDPVAVDLKRQGDQAIDAGLYEEALDAYSRALAIQPGPALHYNRGRALQALGRFAEAIAELEEFERTAPPELLQAVPRLAEMMTSVRARVARLTLVTQPRDAVVFIDGTEILSSRRQDLALDAGEHRLRIEASEFLSHEQRFSLAQGQARTLSVELTPVPRRALVHVLSPVDGALVEMNGRVSGAVPLDLELDPGTYELRLEHPDYVAASTSVVVVAGDDRTINMALDRKPQFYETWWFWTGVGVVAAIGVTTAVALSTEKEPGTGDIPPGRITAPLLAF